MPVTVRIPTPLRTLTGNLEEVTLEKPGTVGDAIQQLDQKHPGIRDRLLDAKGVRKFINVYVGEEDIRFLEGLQTKLEGHEQISIVPAIAGGR